MEKKVFGSIPVTECVDLDHKQSLFADTSFKAISQAQFRFIARRHFPKVVKNRLCNIFFNLITVFIVFGIFLEMRGKFIDLQQRDYTKLSGLR